MTTTENEFQGNLRYLLTLIFKHKVKMITVFLAVVAVVTAAVFLTAPTYEASSKILVKFGRQNVFIPTSQSANGANPIVLDSERAKQINSEVEILTSRTLIETVINELGAETLYPGIDKKSLLPRLSSRELTPLEKAILAFKKKMTVAGVKDSNIITIKFQHNDPLIAARVVNKQVGVFLEHHLNVYKEPEKYGFFDEQVVLQKKSLNDVENKLETVRKENDITILAKQKELLLQQVSDLEVALSQTNSEISRNEGKRQSLRGNPAAESAGSPMGEETDLNPFAISWIRNRLSELKLQEQDLLTKYTEQSNRVVDIRQEIEKAQKVLYKEERMYHAKALVTIGHNLNSLKRQAEAQEKQLIDYQQRLNSINSTEQNLKELERELKIHEENYQLYVKHREEARISNAMDNQRIVNISVVEPALPPINPVKPNKLLNIILSIFLGAFAAFGIAFLSEFSSHTLNNNEDISTHLGLPVFASIPELSPYNPVEFKLSHQIAEENHRLKHHLISSAADGKVKTILFSASSKGEGTSSVLSTFAITLAAGGDKVLLVDANLRNPSLHNLFKLDKKDGLTELLLENQSLNDVTKKTTTENLLVITSGVSHPNPFSLFGSPSLDSLIEKMKSRADWILFDSPSIHSCSDAGTLAAKMDGVLMVVQAESTRWEVVQSAKQRIENKKIKILGVVLNKRKMHIPGWAYKIL